MSIIKHVTLQKIVAHDFRYDLSINVLLNKYIVHLLTKIKDFDNIYTFVLFRKFG